MEINTDKWTKIGESKNADFFELKPQILVVVPKDGTTDDEETAKASIQIQLEYLRSKNQKAVTIILLDPISEQTSSARTVYREMPDREWQIGFALVGQTFFGRAVGSFFLGISKPPVPTKMFATFEEALAWSRQIIKA